MVSPSLMVSSDSSRADSAMNSLGVSVGWKTRMSSLPSRLTTLPNLGRSGSSGMESSILEQCHEDLGATPGAREVHP